MSRRQRARQIATLDPRAEYHEVFKFMATQDLAWEHRFGLNLAFYRIFAVPRMAKLLVHTGEIEQRPVKRTYDTGLLMYDLSFYGPEHPRGREMIRKLNRMHRRWQIGNEDYLYVLAALVVVPMRFIDEYGWRHPTAQEREANFCFYHRVGELMAIRDIPATAEDMDQFFDAYEARHLAASEDGRLLMDATKAVAGNWFPRPLAFLADPIPRVLLGDDISRCVGQEPAPVWARALVRGLFAGRRLVRRVMPHRRGPLHLPGDPAGPYNEGYTLEDLGPVGGRRRDIGGDAHARHAAMPVDQTDA